MKMVIFNIQNPSLLICSIDPLLPWLTKRPMMLEFSYKEEWKLTFLYLYHTCDPFLIYLLIVNENDWLVILFSLTCVYFRGKNRNHQQMWIECSIMFRYWICWWVKYLEVNCECSRTLDQMAIEKSKYSI